jgi:uncharacterized protein YabE (DUF348 family)
MSVVTSAVYDVLVDDAPLTALLSTYGGEPAVFTTEPAPGDATMPYIVTAGDVAQVPADTKTTRGRQVTRDVRCYTAAGGSAATVESIAERVRTLLHRQEIEIDGYGVVVAECSGPIAADEQDAYGRIVTVRMTIEEV